MTCKYPSLPPSCLLNSLTPESPPYPTTLYFIVSVWVPLGLRVFIIQYVLPRGNLYIRGFQYSFVYYHPTPPIFLPDSNYTPGVGPVLFKGRFGDCLKTVSESTIDQHRLRRLGLPILRTTCQSGSLPTNYLGTVGSDLPSEVVIRNPESDPDTGETVKITVDWLRRPSSSNVHYLDPPRQLWNVLSQS